MPTIAAVLSNILGVLASLTMIILLLVSAANAKPEMLAQIKWMSLSIAGLEVISLGVSIWFLTHQRPWQAAIAGIVPLLAVIVLVIVLVKMEW